MLAIYLPRQRALIEADSFNPQPGPGDPPSAIPNLVQFYGAVQKLGLDVDQIIPIHGRVTPFEEGLTDMKHTKPLSYGSKVGRLRVKLYSRRPRSIEIKENNGTSETNKVVTGCCSCLS
jgi:hypothetical protein